MVAVGAENAIGSEVDKVTSELLRCVGLHMPKCAGTSLMTFVRRKLVDGQYYIFSSFEENRKAGRPEFYAMPAVEKLWFVFGHTLSEGMVKVLWDRPTLLFTGLRHPEKQLLSFYRHHINVARRNGVEPPSLNKFVAENSDSMCQQLVRLFPTAGELGGGNTLAERAISVLSLFEHIYETDEFKATIRPVLDALKISDDIDISDNVNPVSTAELDPDTYEGLIKEMYENTSADRELYLWFKDHCVVDALGRRRIEKSPLTVKLVDLFRALPDVPTCQDIVRQQVIGSLLDEAVLIGGLDRLCDRLRREIETNTEILREARALMQPAEAPMGPPHSPSK
jgi:hypothetical protein